jgi:hypothetical protein
MEKRNQTNPRPPAALPSIERLRQVLDYDPDTGRLTWAITRPKCPKGAPAGSLRQDGYRAVSVDRCNMLASRVAWALVHGAWPTGEIGHRDGDRTNDAISNLIDAPREVHHANRTKPDRDSRAPALGIRRRGNRWHARYAGLHLGAFSSIGEAFKAYLAHRASTGRVYRQET